MANEMQIVIYTLYSKGDLIIAKIKESKEVLPLIIEHTTETASGSKTTAECLFSPAFFICCSLVLIAIISVFCLLKYNKRLTTNQTKTKELDLNNQKQEKLLALKKEYQRMVLDYLKEKGGEYDVNKDAFITTINGYIADIESSLKGDEPSVH